MSLNPRHKASIGISFHTAVMVPIAPAIRRIALAHGGDVLRRAVYHRQLDEVAAILGCQLGDEVLRVWLSSVIQEYLVLMKTNLPLLWMAG